MPWWEALGSAAAGALSAAQSWSWNSSCSSLAAGVLLLLGCCVGWWYGCAWGFLLRGLVGHLDRRIVRSLLRAGAQLLAQGEAPPASASARLKGYANP